MRRLLTPRWLLGHLTVVTLVAVMLWLAWWQIGRARAGNALSIGYSLEWPVFAFFVVFFWVKAIRQARKAEGADTSAAPHPAADVPPTPAAHIRSSRAGDTTPQGEGSLQGQGGLQCQGDPVRLLAERRHAAIAAARSALPTDDPEVAAYNHYLTWLNANPHRQPGDYPGMESP